MGFEGQNPGTACQHGSEAVVDNADDGTRVIGDAKTPCAVLRCHDAGDARPVTTPVRLLEFGVAHHGANPVWNVQLRHSWRGLKIGPYVNCDCAYVFDFQGMKLLLRYSLGAPSFLSGYRFVKLHNLGDFRWYSQRQNQYQTFLHPASSLTHTTSPRKPNGLKPLRVVK